METYYGVSDWTVTRWINEGMPVEPVRETKGRRFDLDKVRAWHAGQDAPAEQSA